MRLKRVVYMGGQVKFSQIQYVLKKERYRHSKDDPVWDSSCSSSLVIPTIIYLINQQKITIEIKIEEYQIQTKANW